MSYLWYLFIHSISYMNFYSLLFLDYIQPHLNVNKAAEQNFNAINKLDSISTDAPKFI